MSESECDQPKGKPIPPKPWECCGGGCSPCVWDTYYDKLHEWNQVHGIDQDKISLVDNDPEYR